MVHSRTTSLGTEKNDEWSFFLLVYSPARQPRSPTPSLKNLPVRPRALTSSWEGLVAAARDRPRDMFTASVGTVKIDVCIVGLIPHLANREAPWVRQTFRL